MSSNAADGILAQEKQLLTKRNFWCFALGTFGRDFAYNLFVTNLISFILFTKTLSDLQFTFVSVIIIVARIFDAINDPIMGGIVENTRTLFGKFRPWIMIGAVTTCIVIVLLFSLPTDGWGFIALLAVMYFAFSITYTMNDISYWALLPHLARNTHDRNKLSSVTQLVVSAGGGLALIAIPALTTTYSRFLGGSARSAYMWISIICAVFLMISTFITFFGVQDHTEVIKGKSDENAPAAKNNDDSKLSVKDMFRVLKNNDQLLYAALIMTIVSIGTGVIGGGLLTTYVYFNFGYDGLLTTVFSALAGIMTVLFTIFFPALMKKMGRTRLINTGGCFIVGGYALLLVLGLAVPNGDPLFEVLGMKFNLKFILMMFVYGFACLGQSCYYNMMFLNISNTVEYNEWKTGKREESLIFSLRPFTAKMSSALQQLFVTVVYLAVGVLGVTNGISALDRQASRGEITNAQMLEQVNDLLASVPDSKKNGLLIAMCLIPALLTLIAMIIYKKKFILNDETYERIKLEIAERKQAQAALAGETLAEIENEGTDAELGALGENAVPAVENAEIDKSEAAAAIAVEEEKENE